VQCKISTSSDHLRAHSFPTRRSSDLFAAEFHDYDWRLPVSQLGAGLVERVRAGGAARVAIVAHSMGGLIARAALSLASLGNVERSEEHTSELQSLRHLVCRLLHEKKK